MVSGIQALIIFWWLVGFVFVIMAPFYPDSPLEKPIARLFGHWWERLTNKDFAALGVLIWLAIVYLTIAALVPPILFAAVATSLIWGPGYYLFKYLRQRRREKCLKKELAFEVVMEESIEDELLALDLAARRMVEDAEYRHPLAERPAIEKEYLKDVEGIKDIEGKDMPFEYKIDRAAHIIQRRQQEALRRVTDFNYFKGYFKGNF